MPTVGLIDLGVADQQEQLAPFRRGGSIIHAMSAGKFGHHGTYVASRIVFGDVANPVDFVPAGS